MYEQYLFLSSFLPFHFFFNLLNHPTIFKRVDKYSSIHPFLFLPFVKSDKPIDTHNRSNHPILECPLSSTTIKVSIGLWLQWKFPSFPRLTLPSRGGSLLPLSAARTTNTLPGIVRRAMNSNRDKRRGRRRKIIKFAARRKCFQALPTSHARGTGGISLFVVFWPWANRGRVIFLALRARVPFRGRRRGADIISFFFLSWIEDIFFLPARLDRWEIWSKFGTRLVRVKAYVK